MARLVDLTPVLGHHAYVAGALFEVEGRWSADESEPAVRVHLARYSRYHGWHAELWTDLLPDSVGLAHLVEVTAPDQSWSQQLAALGAIADTGARLAVLYRCVVPRLLTATEGLMDVLSPVADAASLRAGRFVASDLAAEQEAGSLFLDQFVTGERLRTALADAASVDLVLAGSEFGR